MATNAGRTRRFGMFINGQFHEGRATMEVLNPATEQVVGSVAQASADDVDRAVKAAKEAFTSHRATPLSERREWLRAIAERIEANADELVDWLIQEQGKPRSNATGEVAATSRFARVTADLDIADRTLREDATSRVVETHRPLGVIAAIAPWNYPLLLGYWKVFAALATGNAVILKPSPFTPISSLRAAELIADIVPPGLLNVLAGGDEVGRALVAHPDVAGVSFTGSSATGKSIMASAAGTLKRVSLELGGNDAAIVLPDADVAKVAPKIFRTAFNNSGQICMAIKRLYVHDSLYEAMAEALTALANEAKVGRGDEPGVEFGPIQNKMQFEKVCAIVEDARARGAVIRTGGKPVGGSGYLYPITIVTEIAEGSRLVDEEPFGPVLPLIRFHDVEDAISRANASIYGLGGSIWTSDPERGAALAARLQCGTAWVNQHSVVTPDIPFAGAKCSGIGLQGGVRGLEDFMQIQVVNVSKV